MGWQEGGQPKGRRDTTNKSGLFLLVTKHCSCSGCSKGPLRYPNKDSCLSDSSKEALESPFSLWVGLCLAGSSEGVFAETQSNPFASLPPNPSGDPPGVGGEANPTFQPPQSLSPSSCPPPPAHHPGPISSFGRTVSLLHLCSFNSRGRNDEEEESPRWGEGPQVSSRQPDLECPEHVRALRPGPRPGHLCAQHVMRLEVQSLQLGWLTPNPRSMSRQISDFGEVVSSSMPQFSHL